MLKIRFELILAAAIVLALCMPVRRAMAVCDTLGTNITHDLAVSNCTLCDIGDVTIRITHPGRDADLTDLHVTENLGASGLTYIPGSTTFSVRSGPAPFPMEPAVAGPNGSVLTWNLGNYVLPISGNGQSNAQYLEISFQVRRAAGLNEEGLILANRTVEAMVSFSTVNERRNFIPCSDIRTSGPQLLPLHEPILSITKLGRNVDASQGVGEASNTVYGNIHDDVIWQVEIENNGEAALQDLKFDDLMQPGNFQVNYACPTDAEATTVAANDGVAPGGSRCVAAGNVVNDFLVDDPFGNPGGDEPTAFVDVPAGGSGTVYLVGKITDSCGANTVNTVSDVQWGCEADPPDGGISQTSTGASPGTATATLSSRVVNAGGNLDVVTQILGSNTARPAGSKGTVRINIRNNTGGTVKGIRLRDVLPVEYVLDPTFTPAVTMTSAYGAYPGMTDRIEWTNPVADTFPLTTADPAAPLANTTPEFRLFSSTTHPVHADQFDLLRHGDELVVTFRIVLVRPQSYDLSANADVRVEAPNSDPPGTDPANAITLTNELYVDFEEFCTPGVIRNPPNNPLVTTHQSSPEDLDVDISGNELIFILTGDPEQRLPLTVALRNRGGHDAADYFTYVTFGATMDVVAAPAGCSVTSNPPPLDVWRLPATIPADATVYQCTGTAIRPGQTRRFDFEVVKATDAASLAADDLTFRADVVGEITLSDGTPLWFPTPVPRGDGVTDRANNYSLDAIRARVVGFNLRKSQVGTCTENNPPPTSPDRQVQIGEECTYHIDTGGWFGFQTPGFTYIAVQDIAVADQLPDGQGYLSSTDPHAASTAAILGISLNPPGLSPLDEVAAPEWMNWTFNRVVPAERITEKDHWFRVDMSSRLLNDPVDVSAPPNRHAALSTNVLNSTFQAVFHNESTGLEEVYDLGPGTVGYPRLEVRRIDLTVTEPEITVVKEVCNESLHGAGPACAHFAPLAEDGDAFSSYIYRITLTNEAQSDGVQRAPAYEVTVTDTLDAADLAFVLPFAGDGLDNDGDGMSGGGDAEEGTVSDNVVKNGVPAQITFSHTHSSALRRIDPGQSVALYYRVDFDDDAAPLQTFTNEAEATYDSLAGDFGNQSAPQRPNGDGGGARVYRSEPDSASVRIVPVQTRPKSIVRVSSTPLEPGAQGVSIGEEVEYQLNTLLPVALLRDFVIRDELPEGLLCAEAPVVDLGAPPYAAAGFLPGGVITPTCTDALVEWDFGDQRVTSGSAGNLYDFAIRFIARVENTVATNDGDTISNGGAATSATARYIDEGGSPVVLGFGQADVQVREPRIELTKAFGVAEADAGDLLTVTVTAANTGTADAFNLRILDDLTDRNLTFIQGSVSGADPPDAVDLATFGPNQPVFIWNPANPITVGQTVSFTFEVRVDVVEPLEILDNAVDASWTSLAASTTALNSSGTIGADGTPSGLRNGALPNSGEAVNDYETSAGTQIPVPAVALTKTDLAPERVPAVGVHKSFRVEIALPEGTTRDLSVTDSLNAAGLSYVLANSAAFDVTYAFEGIAAINGQPPSEAAFNAVPADGAAGEVVWDIGTVVTLSENDPLQSAIDPVIRIVYFTRINNDLDTDAGDTLLNGVAATYLHGQTGAAETITASTSAVTVSEPGLTLGKALANVTPGKAAGEPPAIGDLLEYRLSAINTGSSDSMAFDVNLVDILPAGLVLEPSFTPTAMIDSAPVPGFVPVPAGAPAGPLVWGRDNGDGSLDIPAGQLLVLTYRAAVQSFVDPARLIENGVLADWTSLEDASPFERTGAGCPDITAPNDYCAGPVVAATTGVVPEAVFQKTVVNETTGEDPGANARPGDVLRYRLRVANIGVLPITFSLVDDLDLLNGIPLFAAGTLTPAPGNPGTDESDPNGGTKGSGLLDIRDLSLEPGEALFAEFTVQLAPVISSGTVALNQGQLRAAGMEWLESDDPNVGGEADPTRTLISSAPELVVEKVSQDLTGDPAALFAGDILRYTLTVRNTGSEDAVDVALRDEIPENTIYVPGSTTLNGEAVADPAPGESPLQGGIPIHAPGDPTAGTLRADGLEDDGGTAIVTFEVRIDGEAASGTIISNQGFVSGEGEGSGAFPETPSDDPATANPGDPTLDVVSSLEFRKSVFNVTTGADGASARPGDVLRYRLEVTNTGTVPLEGFALIDELELLQPEEPPLFVPGSLALVTLPPGADGAATDPNGGAKGTGRVEVRNLSLESGETLTIEFTARLVPVITNGTEVLNQGELVAGGETVRRSDDDDPAAEGDADLTRTLIDSAPAFLVEKISQDLTEDPAVLLAGETLRYTLTVRNTGSEDAVDVVLGDQVPANTAYVPGSTALNGVSVADIGGLSPLQGGLLLHSPADPTPGILPAAESDGNAATVTFDVLVNTDVVDGTIVSNQGFVSGGGLGGGVAPEKPSDDPATPVEDDPTRDVVGNLPLLLAHKTVEIFQDFGSTGIVDPGDVLRYTFVIANDGAVAATDVVLTDAVPADTTYVADSLRLDGAPVGADGGVPPLVAGVQVQSPDQPGAGAVSAGASVVITFEARVDDGVPTGTVISNQGSLSSAELPALPTDADGIPANGYQPTQVVVGDAQQLTITKEVSVIGASTAQAGGELEYTIRVVNIGTVTASDVVIIDDLGPIGPDPLVPGSATLDGLVVGVGYAPPLLTASLGDLPPGGAAVLRFRVAIGAVPLGATITNTAEATWNTDQRVSDSASVDIGGIPGSGILNGRVWHDANLDKLHDGAEQRLNGWPVELYRGSQLLATVLTDGDGHYRFSGLAPNEGTTDFYELRFRAAGAGPNTASLGNADSLFTNGPQRIAGVTVASGGNLQDLNLPITPNGVVYDSVQRVPVVGARLALLNAATGTPLTDRCFDDPIQQNQTTAADGFYKFDVNFSDPSCSPGGAYLIDVTAPAAGYEAMPSRIIPPASDEASAPFSVPACPGSADDAVPTTAEYCEVTASASVPPLSMAARSDGTAYHLHLTFSNGQIPGHSQVFNNPIPIDPEMNEAVAITKTSPLINVTKGQMVPYTITVNNVFGVPLRDVGIIDRFPAGFKYVEGSARLDGEPREPVIRGRELVWDSLELQVNESHSLQLLLIVGAGVSEGEYVNRAQVLNTATGGGISGEATATVRVIPDPTFDCTDVIGKVFDDRNLNGYQDDGEQGLAGVRVVTARGLIGTTDEHGRFHITCAVVPDEDRGSNFILKLDDRSLPTGYRVTTENPRVQRATRGKMMKFNFGATIHRVVSIDIADGVFEPETTELRLQWQPKIGHLLEELRKAPSVLRLSYLGDIEREELVKRRLRALKKEIADLWSRSDGGYRLTVETEVFWRKGGPVQ